MSRSHGGMSSSSADDKDMLIRILKDQNKSLKSVAAKRDSELKTLQDFAQAERETFQSQIDDLENRVVNPLHMNVSYTSCMSDSTVCRHFPDPRSLTTVQFQ